MTEPRKIGFQDADPTVTAALRAEPDALGCSRVDIGAVVELLDEGEEQGSWGWETGLISAAHRSGMESA